MRDRMLVFCTEPSHPTKRCKVESFERPDWTGHWVPDVDAAAGTPINYERAAERRTEQTLVDDTPDDSWSSEGTRRRRYRLTCRLCALTVELQDDRLQRILDELCKSGQGEVSLRLLSAA